MSAPQIIIAIIGSGVCLFGLYALLMACLKSGEHTVVTYRPPIGALTAEIVASIHRCEWSTPKAKIPSFEILEIRAEDGGFIVHHKADPETVLHFGFGGVHDRFGRRTAKPDRLFGCEWMNDHETEAVLEALAWFWSLYLTQAEAERIHAHRQSFEDAIQKVAA